MQATKIENEYFRNFVMTINAEGTKELYKFIFKKYSTFVNGNIMPDNPKILEAQIVDFVLSQDRAAENTRKSYLQAIFHFYTMNDVILNKTKISRFVRSNQIAIKRSQGYSREQIRKIVDVSTLRTRAIVLLYASTGMRLDALIKLKMEDLKTVELEDFTIYQITVYAGFNEEYITFCTPECYELLQIYFNERQKYGEKFKPTTPIIRNLFHTVNASPLSILHPRFLTSKAIQDLLMNKLQQSGIRNVEHSETKYQSSLRKSVPLVHGFRKFFNTCLMNSDVNYVFKELLMGHSVKLDNVYYDKNSEKSRLKLLEEYAKAIDALTIYEENRLKKQVKELTVKKAEMDRMRLELDELYHMIKGS